MTKRPQSPAFDPPLRNERLATLLKQFPEPLFGDRLYRSIELLERYSIDAAIDVLTRLEILDHLTEWRSAANLCELLSFQPRFTFALNWLLQRVIETGCLETQRDGGEAAPRYRLRGLPWLPDLNHLRAIGLDIDPVNAPTLALLETAARLYPAVARGEQSGEQALFGTEGIPLWLNYFSNKNPTYAVNNWVAAIAATSAIQQHGKLRVLELGAGAGSASEILLRCLDQANLLPKLENYLITEPNAFFLRRGQRELSSKYPHLPLKWRALDINEAWPEQGIAPGEFDLILGVNVLHVANDLLRATRQAREALAGNGWLVIGECVRPHSHQPIYVELIFQLLDSFTSVLIDPDIRPNPGFLTAEQWQRVFACADFTRTEVTPDIDRIRDIYPHFFTAAISGQK
ncbi:MAG: hypothetical protein DLM52_03860 [Chthoniobacterales bacterium]|nr:MAG: hypothetical protein DLM52_03860 [Chthoniobacterales bacterium]